MVGEDNTQKRFTSIVLNLELLLFKTLNKPILCVRCRVSGVRCLESGVRCFVLRVTCHMPLTPTATATHPPPTNSLTMQSRMVCKDLKLELFFSVGQFFLNSELKLDILRSLPIHHFYVRNLFVINHFHLRPL